jgi:hypothetical protein
MKLVITLLLIAVLLTACNMPDRPGPADQTVNTAPGGVGKTAPTATPVTTIFMPQQMRDGAAQIDRTISIYFFPNPLPLGLALNAAKSYADEFGFGLELEKPGVQVAIMGGDLAEVAWDEASTSGVPVTVRGFPGYAFNTSNGATLHWIENDQYFLAGGLGVTAADVLTLVSSLESLDQKAFQARIRP